MCLQGEHRGPRFPALQQSVKGGCLTFAANSCGKWVMTLGRFKLAQFAPLRAALALVFIVLSSVQPGLFATANATGLHADNGMMLSSQDRDHQTGDGQHDHHDQAVADTEADDDDPGTSTNASCEVHCAPIHGFPADFSPVFPAFAACPPEMALVAFQPGDLAELKRPPRV
jgi:hypothetical protein